MAVQETRILKRLNNSQMTEDTNYLSADELDSLAFCSGGKAFICDGFLAQSQGPGGCC